MSIYAENASDTRDIIQREAIKTWLDTGRWGTLCLAPGYGKCLGKDTPVLMYDGTVKKVQDIKRGDVLMGDDSTPRNVLSTIQGQSKLHRITPVKGDS